MQSVVVNRPGTIGIVNSLCRKWAVRGAVMGRAAGEHSRKWQMIEALASLWHLSHCLLTHTCWFFDEH